MTILRASSFACASAPEINTSQFGCHICSQRGNIARDCYFTGRVLQFGWEAACLLQRQRTLAKHCICIVANIKLELDQTVNTTKLTRYREIFCRRWKIHEAWRCPRRCFQGWQGWLVYQRHRHWPICCKRDYEYQIMSIKLVNNCMSNIQTHAAPPIVLEKICW